MLPRINRIKKKKDFENIFKNGTSFRNSVFVLRLLHNNTGQSRFGFIVSQKVSKKAVIRNRVRRRLAEIIRREFKAIKSGTDVVVISLPGADKKDFLELQNSLNILMAKAKVILTGQNK